MPENAARGPKQQLDVNAENQLFLQDHVDLPVSDKLITRRMRAILVKYNAL